MVYPKVLDCLGFRIFGSIHDSLASAGVPGIGKLPAQQASPILRRHSWSLNTARSLGQEKQCSPELQPSAAPRHSGAQHSGAQQLQPGTPSRSSSMGAQSPYAFPSLPQVRILLLPKP